MLDPEQIPDLLILVQLIDDRDAASVRLSRIALILEVTGRLVFILLIQIELAILLDTQHALFVELLANLLLVLGTHDFTIGHFVCFKL